MLPPSMAMPAKSDSLLGGGWTGWRLTLNQYSIDLEYWSNAIMETHETVAIRELLEAGRAQMSAAMAQRLATLDAKAKELLETYRGEETWDVVQLRHVVALAYPDHRQAA